MNPLTGLSVGRILIGAAALLAPGLFNRALGLDPGQTQLAYMNRMFGSREIALGAATLAAPAALKEPVVAAGIAIDVADAAAGALAGASGAVSKGRGFLLAAPALAAVAVGAVAIASGRR